MPKSYEPCYTKTNKSGGKYTTCEGAQKKRKAKAKLKKGGDAPILVKNPNPNVNPWGTTADIQTYTSTYKVDSQLFLEGLNIMASVGKQNLAGGQITITDFESRGVLSQRTDSGAFRGTQDVEIYDVRIYDKVLERGEGRQQFRVHEETFFTDGKIIEKFYYKIQGQELYVLKQAYDMGIRNFVDKNGTTIFDGNTMLNPTTKRALWIWEEVFNEGKSSVLQYKERGANDSYKQGEPSRQYRHQNLIRGGIGIDRDMPYEKNAERIDNTDFYETDEEEMTDSDEESE